MSESTKLVVAAGVIFVFLLLKTLTGIEIPDDAADKIVEAVAVIVAIVLGLIGKNIERRNEVNAVTAEFQERIRRLSQK